MRLLKLALVAHGELMTALSAAAGQYLAAIGRLHTLAEAVYRLATTTVRLVGTFHGIN